MAQDVTFTVPSGASRSQFEALKDTLAAMAHDESLLVCLVRSPGGLAANSAAIGIVACWDAAGGDASGAQVEPLGDSAGLLSYDCPQTPRRAIVIEPWHLLAAVRSGAEIAIDVLDSSGAGVNQAADKAFVFTVARL